MRAAPLVLGLFACGSLACKIDNPAFMLTEGDGGATAGSGDASTSGRTTTDATTATAATTAMSGATGTSIDPTVTGTSIDPTASVSTGPATTEPLTSGPDTGTSTGGDQTSTGQPDTSPDGSTSLGDTCNLALTPDYGLGLSSSNALDCLVNGKLTRAMIEPLQFVEPNKWKLTVCNNFGDCIDPGEKCMGETLSITFDGDPSLVPDFTNTPCLSFHAITRGLDQNQVCRLRALRLGDGNYDFAPPVYVGGVAAPTTGVLPDQWPFAAFLGFTIGSEPLDPCDGEMLCNNYAPGTYNLIVTWQDMQQYAVPQGTSFGESLPVKKNGQPTQFTGEFYDIASQVHPGQTCDEGLDFDWLWLADHIAPNP